MFRYQIWIVKETYKDYLPLYKDYLPFFLIHSVYYGYVAGSSIKDDPLKMFHNMISYGMYGLVVGFFYPVTFPLLAGYTFYKRIKNESN